MDIEAVRTFALRDWGRLQSSKRDYWARKLREEGTEAVLLAAETLRRFVQSVHPDWPTPEEREADLRHHIQLKRDLDAARDVFARG